MLTSTAPNGLDMAQSHLKDTYQMDIRESESRLLEHTDTDSCQTKHGSRQSGHGSWSNSKVPDNGSLPTRTKVALTICLLVFLTHTMAVLTLRPDSSPGEETDGNDSLSPYSSRHKYSMDDPLTDPKLWTGSNDPENAPLVDNINKDTAPNDGDRRSVVDGDSKRDNGSGTGLGKCRTGHIQGLAPFCDPHGCLTKLQKPSESHQDTRHTHVISQVSKNIARMHADHDSILFLAILGEVQKDFGLYGSIGLFEHQHQPLYTDFFEQKDGADSIERVFKWTSSWQNADQSGSQTTTKPASPLMDNPSGVQYYMGDEHMYIEDSPMALTKQFFVDVSIPQFRVISIHVQGQDVVRLVANLEAASCLLRDGGIISIHGDGNSPSHTVTEVLKQYFNKHGTAALSPCLRTTKNRFYLCTSTWKDRLLTAFVNHPELPRRYLMTKDTSRMFGDNVSFITQLT